MSTQRPDSGELVTAVREFLEGEVQPQLEGSTAFHARVAVNVLKIVERELATDEVADTDAARRLQTLLSAEGSADALEMVLSEAIRSGEIATDDPDLGAHLWASVLGKLAVDNPRYVRYQRAIAEPD